MWRLDVDQMTCVPHLEIECRTNDFVFLICRLDVDQMTCVPDLEIECRTNDFVFLIWR